MTFDTFVIVDWSGGNDRGASPKPDAIWACVAGQEPVYLRNRVVAYDWLHDLFRAELAAGRRVFAGFDFPFGYPAGFAQAVCGSDDPLALWQWFADHIEDAPNSNNRFDIAGQINSLFDGVGPFWGNGLQRDIANLPRKGLNRTLNPFAERRAVETLAKGSFPVWQMSGAGSVGSQVMMGLPVLQRLRNAFPDQVSVWPFEPSDKPITFVEVWPTLFAGPAPTGVIKDAHQVLATAAHFASLSPAALADLLDVAAPQEGWICGVPQLTPPPLRNDCFAMPQGAHWTPVDTALGHLRAHLTCVTQAKQIKLHKAHRRILAQDVTAQRSHPPTPNSAVDGYGFHGGAGDGVQQMPLVNGIAAAGAPYAQTVPTDHAIRILTGAALPAGVDTVVLQEDVAADAQTISFHGPLRQGANARKAGEDMRAGQMILPAGRRLTAADIGTAIAAGVSHVTVRRKLRVGILSTGDELAQAGQATRDDQIYDANRPMLQALIKGWGHRAIDLGCAPDDRAKLRAMLDDAAARCDVIISSGGASAGDADHMAALMEGTGSFALWRIAMKPGRPLAMGLWQGKPVFGLPGNPVAAMVCALVFGRPALARLAGANDAAPVSYALPAGFAKSKKAGRREYLRARVRGGAVEVFASEGSGRISGLSWAEGLVELPDEARTIAVGDRVKYIPFASYDH